MSQMNGKISNRPHGAPQARIRSQVGERIVGEVQMEVHCVQGGRPLTELWVPQKRKFW